MQDLIRKQPRRHLHSGWLFRRGRSECDVSQPRHPRRGHRDHLRPGTPQLSRAAGVLLPDPRPYDANRQGNDVGHQLPLGHLHDQRRAEADRRGHYRRCQRLGPMAGTSGDRGGPGGTLLGRRAGTPGLPGARPKRIHMPFRPTGMEAASTRQGTRRRQDDHVSLEKPHVRFGAAQISQHVGSLQRRETDCASAHKRRIERTKVAAVERRLVARVEQEQVRRRPCGCSALTRSTDAR